MLVKWNLYIETAHRQRLPKPQLQKFTDLCTFASILGIYYTLGSLQMYVSQFDFFGYVVSQ